MKTLTFIVVLAVIASGDIRPQTQPDSVTPQADSTEQFSIRDLEVYDILAQLPRFGRQLWDFVYQPARFSRTWTAVTAYRINPLVIIGWCLSFMAIVYGGYHVVFRRPPFYINYENRAESSAFAVAGLFPFIRFGWEHPYYKGPDEPTLAVYHLGVMSIWFKDVKPSWLSSRRARIFLVAVGVITLAISTLPISSIWGTPASLTELISFYSVVIIYTLFAGWVLVFPLTFIPGYDGKEEQKKEGEKEQSGALGCLLFLWLPVIIVIPIRAFYLSLAAYYGFSLWQMLAMFFGAFVIAGLLAPITFGIFLFTYYWIRKRIDAVGTA